MTAVSTEPTETIATDAIYFIPRKTIHPDPEQPRVHPDDELADSIAIQGIIQAITVRPHPEIENEWMIVDGERRWRGATNWEEIPCRIRLDLEDPYDRLVTQLSANTGKPLSPIEQARAFKLLLDDEDGLSQAELAKRLGIARSTIGDRIRLVEIHPAWMKLIESGRLQVSHAPLIHQYRAVPEEYQVKAAKNVTDGQGWQMQKFADKDDVIPIASMRKILQSAFRDYITRLDHVRSYTGPVLEIEEEDWSSYGSGRKLKKVKYAADIKLWRPIKREAEKRAKKSHMSSSSSYGGGQRYEAPVSKALKALKASGLDLAVRPVGDRRAETREGETIIFNDQGWSGDIHPKVLLEKLDPSTIIHVKGQYGGDELVTTDVEAVAAARAAFQKHAADATGKELAPLRAKLTPAVLEKYAVTGAGVPHLLMSIVGGGNWRGSPKVIALAIGLPINGAVDEEIDDEDDDAILANDSRADAEKLLSAIAAVAALELKVPDDWNLRRKISSGIEGVAFKIDKAKVVKAAAATPAEPKSKKQRKREARAAGKQVGDPSRAHDDNLHGLLDEQPIEEEELVEA